MFSKRTDWSTTPNRFTRELEAARSAGRELLDLTVSNPTEAGFTYDANLLHPLSQPAALVYSPESQGLLSARQAISHYYPGQADPKSLFVVSGTSEAYSYAFRLLCESGDEILIGAPGYPLLEVLADVCDVKLTRFHLFYDHGWHIDLHDLESRITQRTRAIVLVHPNNPTGSYIKEAERDALNQLCANHDLALIIDEVFLDYPLEVTAQRSFIDNDAVLTFVLSGLSKIAGLPQMKAAWLHVCGPEPQKREALRRLEMVADTFLSASTPVQLALPAFLESRHPFQAQLIARLRQNLHALNSALASVPAVSRLLVEGGWYATLRVPNIQNDEELAISLLQEQRVVVEPGHFFDFPSDGYLVLSLMTPPDIFAEGVRRILARF